jgi:hypothetical protein
VTLAHLVATAVFAACIGHFSAAIGAVFAAGSTIFTAISFSRLVLATAVTAILATSSALLAAIAFGGLAFATISAVFAAGFVFATGSGFRIAKFICRGWGGGLCPHADREHQRNQKSFEFHMHDPFALWPHSRPFTAINSKEVICEKGLNP